MEEHSLNICLYSPYVPKHTGGGETHFFDVAVMLRDLGHQVSIAVPGEELAEQPTQAYLQQYQHFLDKNLKGIQWIASPLGTTASFWKKLNWTRQFDVMYAVTDGSLFFSLAKKNILHIQVPYTSPKVSLVERLKLANWSVKNTNSEFTRRIVEKAWKTKIDAILYPIIELPKTEQQILKKPLILSVGRFFRQLHSKRQDILVKCFQKLLEKNPQLKKEWQLVLIGNVEDESFAEEVRLAAKNLPIHIIHNATRAELLKFYRQAQLYWHASGYEVDEIKYPERVEHFGISTAEAIMAGAAPIVVGKGGQLEVVGPELEQWTWQTELECVEKTAQLIADPKLRASVVTTAQQNIHQFSAENFRTTLKEMIR